MKKEPEKAIGHVEPDVGPCPGQKLVQRGLVNAGLLGDTINAEGAARGCLANLVRQGKATPG